MNPHHRLPAIARLAVGLAAAATVVSGCSSSTDADPQPTAPATGAAAVAAGPGEVAVTGDVRNPVALTGEALRAMPQRTQAVTFDSSKGSQSHTFDGAALIDVVTAADPVVDAAAKNPLLSVAVLATASDGYSAAVTWGEASPQFAGTDILVAHTEDGQPLERPRLVVPGDVKGGRYVSDLTELRIVNLADGSTS